ncbi:MAG: YqjD family protein [Chloroherpetonaceae bacterium]
MTEKEEPTSLQEQLGALYEQLKETSSFQTAKHATEQVTGYIEKHPIQSTLIALGVGFLLGALFSSRKS